MDSKIKIDLLDEYSLLAVWEFSGGHWQLLTILRLLPAIATCYGTRRLVFPTYIDPNEMWGTRPKSKEVDKTIKPVSNQELVLELIKVSQGISRRSLAERLQLSATTVGQYLRSLEKQGKIHYRPSPGDSRLRAYYPGAKPHSLKGQAPPSVVKTRKEPPLKIYWVDPRTLQGVAR